MGTISTKTVCPYPFTFPRGVTNGTINDCTVTYAEFLDPGFAVLQVVIALGFGLILLPLYVYRMYGLYLYAQTVKTPIFSLVQFKLYLVGIIISTGMVLESIDLLGARNIITPYFYFVIDEIVAGTLVILALIIVDFYMITAQSGKTRKKGLPFWVLATGSIVTYVNFIGFLIIGMSVPDYYVLFEAFKLYGAAIILVYYCYVSYVARTKILGIIYHSGTESKSDLSMKAAIAFRYPTTLSATDRTILTVKRKFCEWYSVVITTIFATIIIATFVSKLLGGQENWEWALDISELPDAGFIVFKLLYAAAAILVLRLFKVPTVSTMTERRLENMSESKSHLREKTSEYDVSAAL